MFNPKNLVQLVGFVAADPDVRYTGAGVCITKLSVGTTGRGKDAQGNFVNITDYHNNVICWREQAEWAGKYLKKGSTVIVTGSLRNRKWEDQQGVKRTTTEILVSDISFCPTVKVNGTVKDQTPAGAPPEDKKPSQNNLPLAGDQPQGDDDFPF